MFVLIGFDPTIPEAFLCQFDGDDEYSLSTDDESLANLWCKKLKQLYNHIQYQVIKVA